MPLLKFYGHCRNLGGFVKFFVLYGHNKLNRPAFFAATKALKNVFSRGNHKGMGAVRMERAIPFHYQPAFGQRQVGSYHLYKISFRLDGLNIWLLRHVVLIGQIYKTLFPKEGTSRECGNLMAYFMFSGIVVSAKAGMDVT